MGAMLLAGGSASAGPYPMEQLTAWLADATHKLAAIEATIDELERAAKSAKQTVKDVEKSVATTPSPTPKMIARLKAAKEHAADIEKRLAAAYSEREAVLNYIEWIRVQMAAWEEMENEKAE